MEPITAASNNVAPFAALSDDELVQKVKTLAACDRRASVALIRSLIEFDALERGDLTLTAVRLLAPHLTPANHGEVLAAARRRSKQGIQELIASLNPRPAAATIIRRVAPQPSSGNSLPAPTGCR